MPIVFSVVIPTHNRAKTLRSTLTALRGMVFSHTWEIVVVCNNCTDETEDLARQDFPVTVQIVHESTPGPGAARNAGARVASGEYLLFLDDDILPDSDLLTRHLERLKSCPGAWILAQVMQMKELSLGSFGEFRDQLFPALSPDHPPIEVTGLSGQCCSMPRRDFEQLGGFDDTFEVASVEDFDLAIRARALSIRVLLDPSIVVRHNDWAGSSIRDYAWRQRLYTRMEPRLWLKHQSRYPRLELMRANAPVGYFPETLGTVLRKSARDLVGSTPVSWLILGICFLLESTWPNRSVLWRLYRVVLAGAIRRGCVEGFAALPPTSRPSAASCA